MEYPVWISDPIHLTPQDLPWSLEYKYVKVRGSEVIEWESFSGNRVLKVISMGTYQHVTADIMNTLGSPVVLAAPPKILAELKVTSPSRPASSLMEEIVQGNVSSKSWRNKLQLVTTVLSQVEKDSDLAIIASYLHFIKSGAIQCQEDGGHHRPSHHANLSTEITQKLSKSETYENSWLIRTILPSLPSDKPQFTTAVPLTRIRDIAHRGDIPKDLKQEIKNTLQNKLHRSAGPEDLVTCERILQKVLHGSYSPGFVKELKTFYGELKEFFNAQGLDDRLREISGGSRGPLKHLANDFLAAKYNDETSKQRELLLQIRDIVHTSRDLNTWICDIELEGYSFMVYSKLLQKESISVGEFPVYIEYLKELLQHCVFSRFYDEEFAILIKELVPFHTFPDGLGLLRLKATVERCLRQTKDFAWEIANNFQPDVSSLGEGLGVDSHSVSVFSEAIVRSHLAFQLAKVCEVIHRLVRKESHLSPWLIIQPGTCSGVIRRFRDFEEAQSFSEHVVAFIESADGTEEIPSNVTGYLLRHDLPQLSHLAVRTRQRKLPAAACEDAELYDSLQFPTAGSLIVAKDNVSFTTVVRERAAEVPVGCYELKEIDESCLEVLSIEAVTKKTGGAKAYGAKVLQEMSSGGFSTPFSAFIPFGRCRQVIGRLTQSSRTAAIEHIKKSVAANQEVLEAIAREVMELAGLSRKLILRSSSNAEDTAKVSGAGLYDSIPNIASNDINAIIKAISDVWLSLCTERAWLSRTQSGISHGSVCMAVLVQEMLPADYSFIVHTSNPAAPQEMFAEMTHGLGETLASAEQRGSPYRFIFEESSSRFEVVSLASYSFALVPGDSGLVRQRLDYHAEDLAQLQTWGRQIFSASSHIKSVLESHQDIEGLVTGGQVYIVQTRPQV
jgi:phosphoglucan,water dikinase